MLETLKWVQNININKRKREIIKDTNQGRCVPTMSMLVRHILVM
jgi:hypothetical protein